MTKIYEIGPFRLDPNAGVLSHGGRPVALGARAVAVLGALVQRPGEYIRKQSIIDAAWLGVVVEEGNLAVQISAIRRALSRAPGGERWVETLARRGYRFVGPVAELADDRQPKTRGNSKNTNIPESLTSFIGRERELVEIKRLLPGKRLLTITGVGGIGKTRLALQMASEVAEAYDDGVWLVELGSITDPALVPTSVAQVFGVQERTGKVVTDALCTDLRARHLLLILDNCEHLLGACATLADAILRCAAETTILATSREPLRIGGEQTYPLQPLSLPERAASAETVARSEAVQLFVERAQRQLPTFELTATRADTVAELCIHVDGIPLALELAAARVRSLSVEQINARLKDRFKLLTAGARTALPRQQTLRATLDWSFDLLAENERAVLRRLAVFAGSFSLEVASSVASDEAIDEFGVIDLLSQLVARSLIIADTSDAGARYRLLETTRAYALEKLTEAGEFDTIRRRHAQQFRNQFERAHGDWRMPDQTWRATYVSELDNVRAALDWALGADGDSAIGIALAGASGALWADSSLLGEGRQRLESAAARVGAQTPDSDQARVCLWRGILWRRAAPTQSVAALERAVDLYRRLGDGLGLGHSLAELAVQLAIIGRHEQAGSVLAEAFPVLERAELPKALARYYHSLGFVKLLTNDVAGARMPFEKALSLYRSAGAESAALAIVADLADMTWALGDLDAALAACIEAVASQRKSPLAKKYMLGAALTNLAGVHTERGELVEALAAAREGLPLREAAGLAWVTLDHLALRAVLAGKLANAVRLMGFTDVTYKAKEILRQSNEARARKRLEALLRGRLAAGELERLLAEGAKMSEEEACRLALEE